MKEDLFGDRTPMARDDEDEDFDRIHLEIQLAIMICAGFPKQGYIETKAEDIIKRQCTIITRIGEAKSWYECGLPQGSPLSCIMANLVILLKHKCMRSNINGPVKVDQNRRNNGYKFKLNDPADEELIISTEVYSDDNLRYTSTSSIDDLIKKVEQYTELAGKFSLVTKIDRKGSKSGITYYNFPENRATYLQG